MSELDDIITSRFAACKNHPEKEQIFKLEKLLLESGYPYYFNFWEDLKGFWEPDKDPETGVDWNTYKFLIEVGRPAGYALSELSFCFNTEGDRKLLELLDMRPARGKENQTAEDGELTRDLTAEEAMEIIKKFFEE